MQEECLEWPPGELGWLRVSKQEILQGLPMGKWGMNMESKWTLGLRSSVAFYKHLCAFEPA